MQRRSALALALACLGCYKRESPEADLARASETLLKQQIASLETLVGQAEAGELQIQDQIAIGVSESVVGALAAVSLPQEVVLKERVRVRVESARPFFRGNRAGMLFRASASGVNRPGTSASMELGGQLADYRIENGRLIASVKLEHFKVLEASLGDLAADVLEGLVRDNLATLNGLLPPLEIPVRVEEAVRIDGLSEGAVVARAGVLPLEFSVAQVVPVRERLWVLLHAKAGPWQSSETKTAK